jgi:zinc protease
MHSDLARVAAFVLLALVAQIAHAILPIQHWETQRGARVYFVENHDLPILDVSVDVPAGSAFDTREKSGAANMTANMLRLGAGGMDENEIARRLADAGAQLAGRFDMDRAGAGVRTLSSATERRQALEILARILSQPEFRPEVLEREKVRVVGALKEADTQPDTIAARTFSRLLYPAHPYGLRSAGEVDTVARLTREDIVAFHRDYYVAERAVVAITGDVSREEAAAIAESLTSGMPKATSDAIPLPPVPAPADGRVQWVPHHATQSHILSGLPGIRRGDPDYFPLFVGNHVLGGGGFVSRITEEVRTKRGLAYSAYSYFTPMLREGPFVVGMQTKSEQARDALEVLRKTLTDFVSEGPTEKELALAKKNIIGGFPLRIDSNRKIHDYIGFIGFYRLPLTYLDDFTKNVERVTAEDVRRAFQRKVPLDKLTTVIVGQSTEKSAAVEGR